MPPILPTPRERDPAATTPMPMVGAAPHLSARTMAWLAERPLARALVESVWDALVELERAGHHSPALAALRFVLSQYFFIYHEVSW